MGALPQAVLDQRSVDTKPSSALTAAWGDPAIVMRCGVATPVALTPTSQLVSVNGVDWFPEPVDSGYRFTTVSREANVEVLVPDAYAPEANALVDLAATIKDHDPGHVRA